MSNILSHPEYRNPNYLYVSEQWKPLLDFSNPYEVSNYGRIRYVKQGRYGIIRPKAHKNRISVRLAHNGERIYRQAHRFVAVAFCPNPHNLPIVNHLDGDACNNFYKNLEWCTASRNQQHAIETGLRPVGEDLSYSKLTANDVFEIANRIKSGERATVIQQDYNVSRTTIESIIKRKTWKHLNIDFGWRYKRLTKEGFASLINEHLNNSGWWVNRFWYKQTWTPRNQPVIDRRRRIWIYLTNGVEEICLKCECDLLGWDNHFRRGGFFDIDLENETIRMT